MDLYPQVLSPLVHHAWDTVDLFFSRGPLFAFIVSAFRLHMEADIGKSDQTSRATFVESKTTTLIKTLINIRNSRLVGNNITLVLNVSTNSFFPFATFRKTTMSPERFT